MALNASTGNLTVKGIITTENNLVVKGSTTLGDDGASDTVTINGHATLNNNLTVKGNTTLGDDSASDTLTVNAKSTLNNTLTVASGGAQITGNSKITGALEVTGRGTFAGLTSTANNMFICSTNEFDFIPDNYSGVIYINYQTLSRNSTGAVSSYTFLTGNGATNSYADLQAKNGAFSGSLTAGTTASISGNTTIGGTLTLTKTQDLSGTADNSPALIIGGAATSTHMEIDCNEIQAKTNGTSVASLYLNNDGGLVTIGSGGLTVGGLTTANGGLTVGKITSNTSVSGGITIHDIRETTPKAGMFGNKVANLYFDNTGYNSRWQSILHMQGWNANEGYAAWELAGNAHNDNSVIGTLRYRVLSGSTPTAWYKVLFSKDDGKLAQKL
jgi:hypothetical protein